MPRTTAPLATLAVIEEHPQLGDRARYTIPVRDLAAADTAAARAEAVRIRIADETGHAVRVVTHTAAA